MSGEPISAVHDGHRCWQYRVLFTREMALFGPVLHRVQLELGS